MCSPFEGINNTVYSIVKGSLMLWIKMKLSVKMSLAQFDSQHFPFYPNANE